MQQFVLFFRTGLRWASYVVFGWQHGGRGHHVGHSWSRGFRIPAWQGRRNESRLAFKLTSPEWLLCVCEMLYMLCFQDSASLFPNVLNGPPCLVFKFNVRMTWAFAQPGCNPNKCRGKKEPFPLITNALIAAALWFIWAGSPSELHTVMDVLPLPLSLRHYLCFLVS